MGMCENIYFQEKVSLNACTIYHISKCYMHCITFSPKEALYRLEKH